MTTDYRALCAELLQELDFQSTPAAFDLIARARAALAQPEPPATASVVATDKELLEFAGERFPYALRSCYDLGRQHGAALDQPNSVRPTDNDLLRCMIEAADSVPDGQSTGIVDWEDEAIAAARAVLARWGRPASAPIPVSERLPGVEDCTTNPRNGQGQWCWGWVQHDPIPFCGRWRMMRRDWLVNEAVYWLPATALPLPRQPAPDAPAP